MKYAYLIQIICIHFHDCKYSDLILIFHTHCYVFSNYFNSIISICLQNVILFKVIIKNNPQ